MIGILHNIRELGIAMLAEVSNSSIVFVLILLALVAGLIFVSLILFLFVVWVLMLIDALSRKDWQNDDERMMWTIVLILSLFVGLWGISAVVYYYVIKRPRTNKKTPIQEAEIIPTANKQKMVRKSKPKK